MLEAGIIPNEVTLWSVLTACSHADLLVLLGQARLLEEAKKVIELMPISFGSAIWRSLLNGCSVHRNFCMAQIAGKKVIELEPNDDGVYVLLWNMYCAANM